MAYKLVILDSANTEREEIVKFLLEATGNKKAASGFLYGIDKAANLISEFPMIYGLSRLPELAEKGYHTALVDTYVMLYTVSDGTVYIEHIFHQRQDYAHLV